MSLITTMAVTAISALPIFIEAGIVQYVNPNMTELGKKKEMGESVSLTLFQGVAERVGVFGVTQPERQLLDKLIDNWFMDFSANKERSRPNLERLKQAIPAGFNSQKNRVVRNESLPSRYVQVRTNLANLQELGFARAVNAISRRRIGMALSYAKRGQGVDVLLGHNLQSY